MEQQQFAYTYVPSAIVKPTFCNDATRIAIPRATLCIYYKMGVMQGKKEGSMPHRIALSTSAPSVGTFYATGTSASSV